AGQTDAATLSSHPMRHVLTNVLGARDHAEVHVSEHELRGGELILLCSDGLHNVVDDETILELMLADPSPPSLVPRLIDMALANGGRDNVTAVVVRYEGL